MKVLVPTVNLVRNYRNHSHLLTILLEIRIQGTTVSIPIHITQDRYRLTCAKVVQLKEVIIDNKILFEEGYIERLIYVIQF